MQSRFVGEKKHKGEDNSSLVTSSDSNDDLTAHESKLHRKFAILNGFYVQSRVDKLLFDSVLLHRQLASEH